MSVVEPNGQRASLKAALVDVLASDPARHGGEVVGGPLEERIVDTAERVSLRLARRTRLLRLNGHERLRSVSDDLSRDRSGERGAEVIDGARGGGGDADVVAPAEPVNVVECSDERGRDGGAERNRGARDSVG